MTELLSICPVCERTSFSLFMELEDHFLSREVFCVVVCGSCGFRFTNPRPQGNEIAAYYQSDEYISHDAGKTDFLSRIYKLARMVSIRGKYRLVKKYNKGNNILDIGCGTGEFLKFCQDNGLEATGIEPGEKARDYAKTKNSISTYENIELLGDVKGSFSCITMWHVLEHIHDLNGLMIQVKRLLTPGGMFIAAVPNSNSWDASFYKQFWAAYDVPRHLYHFTGDSITRLAEKHGFEIRQTYPQKLDAYYVSMLSEKYKFGKTRFITSIIHGLWSNLQGSRPERGHSSLIFVMSVKKA
jgi:2-polyprenyl-3-methyl-5-hydroxy-6-metoxy-1,4-benzoquinol methylase